MCASACVCDFHQCAKLTLFIRVCLCVGSPPPPCLAVIKERWQLQQEWSRLQAQQTAFDQERQVSLKKVEQEREDLQKAKVSPCPPSLPLTPCMYVVFNTLAITSYYSNLLYVLNLTPLNTVPTCINNWKKWKLSKTCKAR